MYFLYEIIEGMNDKASHSHFNAIFQLTAVLTPLHQQSERGVRKNFKKILESELNI